MAEIGREWALRLPERQPDAHKGTLGTLSILAGCARYRGAAVLAASAALRAGAGLVRCVSTERVCAAVAAHLPACTLLPVAEDAGGGITAEAADALLAQKQTAILAGSGLGNTAGTLAAVQRLLWRANCPLVLDADALNVLAGHLETGEDADLRIEGLRLLKETPVPVILTPHVGEMARLCGRSTGEVAAAREETAAGFATEYGCTVVLKSHITVVALPAGGTHLLDRPNPGLARGGSGDVLAGIIASLLAQGCEAGLAACAGVWLHSEAGMLAAKSCGVTGLSPADLLDRLPEVWLSLGR